MTISAATFLQSSGTGALAGMRSLVTLALVSDHLAAQGEGRTLTVPLRLLSSPAISNLLKVLALGEMVADKAPPMPARTILPALGGRIVSGALAGGILGKVHGSNPLLGAMVGAVAAGAATYGSYHLRRWLGNRFEIPDPALGVLEDAIVVGVGAALLQASHRDW